MKKYLSLAVIALMVNLSALALNPIVDYALFKQPDQSSYIEVYMLMPGASVTYKPQMQNLWQAEVEVTLIFTRVEQNDIAQFDRYILHSQPLADTLAKKPDLIDLKRFALAPGSYNMEITFTDLHNSAQQPVLRKATITIETPDTKATLSLSDVILVEGFTPSAQTGMYDKHGYNMVPNFVGYYPPEVTRLSFYSEIYNADKVMEAGADFLCNFMVINSRRQIVQNLRKFKKMKADAVNVLLGEMDISTLPSGNYFLWVEVRNKENQLLAENATAFQRNNPIAVAAKPLNLQSVSDLPGVADAYLMNLTDEQIKFYLGALAPIAAERETDFAQNAIASENPDIMRRALSAFWRNREPVDPSLAFALYKEKVDYVEQTYRSLKQHGYESDRGRVFLKYGNPNDFIAVPAEAGSLPYEIWHYYRLNDKQVNVKFIFVQTILASNHYELIHSDARGEVKDPRWQMRINNQRGVAPSIDEQPLRDNFGRKSGMYFNE